MVNLELAAQRARGVSFVTSLPVRLDVKIPMPNFRFKDLARLRAGQVLETAWPVSEDLPVAAGDVRLLWAEFSVAERQLTVRVTRVA
jgi:flagellar motor switch protein FliM